MAKKRKKVQKHEVKAELAVHGLSKAGSSLKLQIYADSEKLGELEIGQGSMYWWGNNRRKRMRINWSRFAKHMDQLAYD